jgi:two-component system, OmpR family, phosphate regulon response regulator PhoB
LKKLKFRDRVSCNKPYRVWSRAQLLERVWQREDAGNTRPVDVHIGRLRKAIGEEGTQYPLRTLRGA